MMRKLFEDSFSSVVVPFVKICITFIMAPVIVHSLGNYDYGIWEIVIAIVGYMEFMDIGLMPAIVRNVARYFALKDLEEIKRIYSTSLALFIPVGTFMAGSLLAISFVAPDMLLERSVSGGNKYAIFFIIISIQVFFIFVGSVFDCCLEGMMFYKLRNYTTVAFSIVGALIMYPWLKNGGGLIALATVNTFGLSLKYIFYGIILRRNKIGCFKFNIINVSRQTLKYLFEFGVKSFIWAISLRISILSDPLVIGWFLGAATVPFYMIPSNIVGQARSIIWSITRVFVPTFSSLDALDENVKTRNLYFSASRFMLGIVIPLVGGICLLGPAFLTHWMGQEYAKNGEWVLYIIAIAYFIQWINPFSKRFFTAINKHEILAKAGIVSAILNIALSLVLVNIIGKEGVAIGTLVPVLIFEPYILYKICKELKCNISVYSKNVFMPVIIPSLLFIVVIKSTIILYPIQTLFDVAKVAIGGLVIYVPTFFAVAMKRDERIVVYSHIREKVFSGI